jgi:hypothetical protein
LHVIGGATCRPRQPGRGQHQTRALRSGRLVQLIRWRVLRRQEWRAQSLDAHAHRANSNQRLAVQREYLVQPEGGAIAQLQVLRAFARIHVRDQTAHPDHNENTRWSSGFSDDESLTLDFGKSELINRVRIDWENAHAIQYLVKVSDDNANWTRIETVVNSQGGTEDLSGLNGQGCYLLIRSASLSRRSTAPTCVPLQVACALL